MKASVSCSFCHTMNAVGLKFCHNCGHRADAARMDCDCPQCNGPRAMSPASREVIRRAFGNFEIEPEKRARGEEPR